GDRHATRREVPRPMDRVGREARLALLAVGDDGGTRLLEAADRVGHRGVEEGLEGVGADPPVGKGRHPVDQLLRPRDAADRFGGWWRMGWWGTSRPKTIWGSRGGEEPRNAAAYRRVRPGGSDPRGGGAAGDRSAQTVDPSLYSDLRWRLVGPFRGGWATCAAG